MLHIIGLMLKWIGIILLAILCLLVLLVCIVLFVPVRYEIRAAFPGDPKRIAAQGKCSWLLHLFSVKVIYQEEKLDWKMRFAWKVFKEQDEEEKPQKKSRKKQKAKPKKKKEKKAKRSTASEVKTSETSNSGSEEKAEKKEEVKASERLKQMECKLPQTEVHKAEPEIPEVERPSLWKRICDKIKAFFEKIKYTFRQICDKIKVICETKEKVTEFLENEVHRTAFSKALKEMVWLKRFLKPKKARVDLHFGLEEPDKTGLVLAACGMIYPFVGEYMNIRPDFENQILEGEFYMKGRLRAVYLVILAARLFFDQSIRALYTDIRKIR